MTFALPKGFFITGSDTHIGKTFISGLLADALVKYAPVAYMKPVQTGCLRNKQGDLAAPDFEYLLQRRMTQTAPYHAHVPYRFEPSCSPHLAARLANQEISMEFIERCFIEVSNSGAILTLVEGAGGVMAPLGATTYMLDLMKFLDLPVILVVSPKLGTLNHTLLSIHALRQGSLRLAGVVMNNSTGLPDDFIHADNRDFVRAAIRPIPFIEVNFNALASEAIEAFCRELLQ